MAWNGPTNGDWTTVDASLPPWANGIAVLTHEEVMYVKTETERIISEYVAPWGEPEAPTDAYVMDKYNNLDNWTKAVNGDTYNVIKVYDPEVNTLGIDSGGIIQPIEETPIEEIIEPVDGPGQEEISGEISEPSTFEGE